MDIENLYDQAVALLCRLIEIPSISREEAGTAEAVDDFLKGHDIPTFRDNNNVWAFNLHYDKSKPTILLNSHHDTVRPNSAYTRDPFKASIEDGKLYGLGSTDAGGSVVSLLSAFLYLYPRKNLKYNLCIAITGEEEISGTKGLESVVPQLGPLDFAIIGEPTGMNMAIAERGLLVIDFTAHGKAGHAAREEGENAIYKAIKDIEWLRTYRFPKRSDLFGEMKINVTIINGGTQHNIVPAECTFTADIRVIDKYTNQEVVDIISRHVASEIKPRSMRLRPSSIDPSHVIVRAGLALGRTTYGSPTTSDQALINMTSLKMGVGDSSRSHSADEYVLLSEIKEGIELYIKILESIL